MSNITETKQKQNDLDQLNCQYQPLLILTCNYPLSGKNRRDIHLCWLVDTGLLSARLCIFPMDVCVYVRIYVGFWCQNCRALWLLSVCVFVCVFPGSDETLSLTRCCSVKVKPYRMSGMMTRAERFHLIPPFPFFPPVPPICLPRLRLRPPHSQDKTGQTYTGLHLQSASRLVQGVSACVCMCVCVNSVKSCHPTSKATSQMPEATVSVSLWLAWSLQPAVKHLCFSLQWLHTYGYLVFIIQWDSHWIKPLVGTNHMHANDVFK